MGYILIRYHYTHEGEVAKKSNIEIIPIGGSCKFEPIRNLK